MPVLTAVLFFFCVLTALMVLRPAREALGMQRGIETVRWLFMGTALVTLLVNPLFGLLVSRFRRLQFITATYAFFALSLLGFYLLLVLAPTAVGVTSGQVFYVWFSVFNLFITMVFWAMMADRFSLEQSKRFFALIAAGGTCGALFGPWLATQLAQPFGTAVLLPIAAAFLVLATAAAWTLARLKSERPPNGGPNDPHALGEDLDLRTTWFARMDLITQATTLILQSLVAGRLMQRFGVSLTLTLLPVTIILGFVGLAMLGSLAVLIVFEASFRAVQRALMRPARETLFTVVSREDKYKSKAFIDTFVYRGGDVLGAQTEGLLGRLGMGLAALASVAIPLALVWAALGIWLGRVQRRYPRPLRDA